jgi:hypothetical protein
MKQRGVQGNDKEQCILPGLVSHPALSKSVMLSCAVYERERCSGTEREQISIVYNSPHGPNPPPPRPLPSSKEQASNRIAA